MCVLGSLKPWEVTMLFAVHVTHQSAWCLCLNTACELTCEYARRFYGDHNTKPTIVSVMLSSLHKKLLQITNAELNGCSHQWSCAIFLQGICAPYCINIISMCTLCGVIGKWNVCGAWNCTAWGVTCQCPTLQASRVLHIKIVLFFVLFIVISLVLFWIVEG